MRNIKTYKDGSRLIIVVENCVGETAEMVNRFLLEVLGTTDSKVIPGITPQEATESPAPVIREADEIVSISAPAFTAPISEHDARKIKVNNAGLTLGAAIDTRDTAGVLALLPKLNSMGEAERCTATRLCKEYILNDCIGRDPDSASTAEIKGFFALYRTMISGAIQQILETAGFSSAADFFDLTDEYMHQDAYKTLLDSIIERVKI